MDKLDISILSELQNDGRLANAHLAERLHLSASATLERVRHLERDGLITGYRAWLNPEAMGLTVSAYIGVRLRLHNNTSMKQFETGIASVPSVVHCAHLTGQFDYMLHVAVRDLDHLRNVIRDELSLIPGVANFQTMLWLATTKTFRGWPVEVLQDSDKYR